MRWPKEIILILHCLGANTEIVETEAYQAALRIDNFVYVSLIRMISTLRLAL